MDQVLVLELMSPVIGKILNDSRVRLWFLCQIVIFDSDRDFFCQIFIFVSDRDSFVSQCHGNVFRLIRIYFQKFIDSDNIFFWLCCINPQVTFLGKPKGKFYDWKLDINDKLFTGYENEGSQLPIRVSIFKFKGRIRNLTWSLFKYDKHWTTFRN